MKRHPLPLDRKIIQFLLVCAMALSTIPATPIDASPPSSASEADTALAALTPFLANADDPNTVVLSAVGQIAPAMVLARVGQTVTFANIDTITRTLRLDGTPVDGLPNRAFLPLVVRGGAVVAAPARPSPRAARWSPKSSLLHRNMCRRKRMRLESWAMPITLSRPPFTGRWWRPEAF